MTTPLLATKLYIPPLRPELVPRRRLIERMGKGFHSDRRLTLVSAPAGFGKTTLVAACLRQTDQPSAWLSLDTGDNDPARFFTYLLAALQKVDADIGAAAEAVSQTLQPPPRESLLTTLINDIAATAHPFILVLDDYHVIDAPSIHDTLSFLLENAPPQLQLVIATRADPPLPLPRLRGRGQLSEFYQSDLSFTSEETAQFLHLVLGLRLSAEEVAALERRTEGWIAGLQMAAISMRGRADIAGFVRAFTGSHRYILDYLSEEVLQQQPGDVQEFLLQTAILDRLSAELCDAVTRATESAEVGSQSVLEYLERNNLFVVPLDDKRGWYRYHHLFADLLRQRLQRERHDLVPELHRRASQWYAQNGLITEAIGHALTAGDSERAACLILQNGWATFTRGEMATILGWIAALPDDLVRSRPQLGVLHAWAMAKSGQVNHVETCLRDIDPQRVRGEVAAVRAYVAGVRGDLARAIQLAELALEHLPQENLFLRALVAQNLGVTYHWSGDPKAAARTLTKAITLSRAASQVFQTLTSMAILGRAHEMQGSLHQALQTYREALELASEASPRPVPFAGMAYVGMAGPLYEWNDLDAATRCAMEGVRLSELGGFVAYQVFGYARLAWVHQAQGDRDSAEELLQKAERLGHGDDYALVAALATELRVRLWVAQGRMAAASQWAHEQSWSLGDRLDAAGEVVQMTVAWVRIAQSLSRSGSHHTREISAALTLLARLLSAADASGRTGSAIKILTLQALAYQAQGDMDQALAALKRALSLAEPEGYVRTFLDEGEPMAQLLRDALSQDIAPDYVARLLAAFGQQGALTSPALEALVEPLTDRELEVLRLIVAGLSNPEIAEELVIAVSTVKSHVNHIYGKLGVTNRVEAVTKAQTLRLL